MECLRLCTYGETEKRKDLGTEGFRDRETGPNSIRFWWERRASLTILAAKTKPSFWNQVGFDYAHPTSLTPLRSPHFAHPTSLNPFRSTHFAQPRLCYFAPSGLDVSILKIFSVPKYPSVSNQATARYLLISRPRYL